MREIGLLNEGHLHKALKDLYTEPGCRTEVRVGKYIVDVLSPNGIVEVQTGSFSSIRPKISGLLDGLDVKIVLPIDRIRWLVRDVPNGVNRRKSPRQGQLVHAFNHLVYIANLIGHPKLTIEVCFTEEEHIRVYREHRYFRRRGWQTIERRLVCILEKYRIQSPGRLFDELVREHEPTFTVGDLSQLMQTSYRIAQQAAYCFRQSGVIQSIGKRGRAVLYERV